jgi:Flp pilus assembly protein TadG
MTRARTFTANQRGAIFVQVGIVILVLMAFSVFVLDYGVMWIARAQAQNAADAGALAGAMARGYDDRANPPSSSGLAADISAAVARANQVWTAAPAPAVTIDCPPGVTGRCTTVNVFRDDAHGNALPVLFGPLLGVNSQQVRATASALTGNGNATACMSPIAFADDWDENYDDTTQPGREFSRYIEAGANAGNLITPRRDDYTPPGGTFAGRVTVSGNFGERIVWVIDHAISEPITRERMLALELPGGRTFLDNMLNCSGTVVTPGQRLPMITYLHPVEIGNAVASVFALDPGADYDYGDSRIVNSCAPACAPLSPRLLAVALFDPARFQLGRATNDWTQPAVGCPTNAPCVTVTNIIGFFIHRIGGGFGFGPHGHFLRYPGVTIDTQPTFVDDGSWLVTTHLVR